MDFSNIICCPDPIPNKSKTDIPKFTGDGSQLAEQHVINVKNMVYEFDITYEDVCMKMLVLSLKDTTNEWYRNFPDKSITSWQSFVDQFIEEFGDHRDPSFATHELTSIKKNMNEIVKEFNKRFNKVLNKIPKDIRPVDPFLITFYLTAFDVKTNYEIRSHNPTTSQQAFKIALNIENNRIAVGRVDKRNDPKIFNPTVLKKSDESDKMDELVSLMKNLQSNKGHFQAGRHDRNFNRNDRYRLQDMPYHTEWKDGKPLKKQTDTLDPLKKNNHFIGDELWCDI